VSDGKAVRGAIIRSAVAAAQLRVTRRRPALLRLLALVALVWLAGITAWLAPAADRLERELGLPWLFAARGPLPAPSQAVIVTIDRASAQRLGLPEGTSPWPRRVYAELIRRAAAGGAGVIVLDVFFGAARVAGDDAALAAAIAEAGNVVLFSRLQREVQALPGVGAQGQVQVDRLLRPYSLFARTAAAVAPFVLPKSPARVDTVWTHHPAAPDVPTLPAAALLVQAGRVACTADRPDTAVQGAACDVRQGARERLLNFYGPPRSLTIIPAADVLLGPAPDFAGRAVFIGHAEPYFPNQLDSFLTAVSRPDGLDLAGVEIAATAYLNWLRGESLWVLPPAALAAGLLASALALVLLLLSLRPVGGTLAAFALLGAVGVGLPALFRYLRLWLPLVPWLVQITAALLGALAWRARDSGRERAQVAAAFRQYLPAHVVRQVAQASGGSPLPVTPARRHAVCLISDATGYTRLAERLPAAALSEVVNRYYATLLAPIDAEGGIVTDIVGDSAQALWPLDPAGIAQRLRACRAAIGIQAALAGFQVPGGGGLPTRIGLHVGEVLLGPVGALDHYEYRAIGDAVNTASRIEALNKRLGTRILASEAVIAGVAGLDVRRVGRFRLAGKSEPLELYELLHGPTAAQARARPFFDLGLDAFSGGDANTAWRAFEAAQAADPGDTVSVFYLALLQELARCGDKLPALGLVTVPK
jgi:adenylate cyclase